MNNPLTDEQRTSMIENLINDCDCWDEEDREVLANFGDEKLQKLVNNVTRTHTNESKSTSTETLDLSSLSMNELEEEIKRRKKMMSANQGGEEESEEVSNQNLSPEEWLENAPDEIKNTFRYAHQIEQEQKDVLVEKLTANIKDGAEKRIQAERLRKRSIDDLKADVDLIPATPAPVLQQQTQNSEEKKTEDADTAWLSNMMNRMTREPEDDPLPLPTINWGSESEEDNIERAGSIQSSVEDPDQWLRSAPAPIREVVQNALKSEKREKDELISSLVENIEDSSKRFKMRDKLEAKPLAELREMLEFIPKEKTPPPRKPNYTGSAAPAVNRLSDTDKEDILPLPSMNYGS